MSNFFGKYNPATLLSLTDNCNILSNVNIARISNTYCHYTLLGFLFILTHEMAFIYSHPFYLFTHMAF